MSILKFPVFHEEVDNECHETIAGESHPVTMWSLETHELLISLACLDPFSRGVEPRQLARLETWYCSLLSRRVQVAAGEDGGGIQEAIALKTSRSVMDLMVYTE
ncbi:hypothetical protein P168DRAFT_291542 [Aspergillus campestris IBT 28561]|uniref:Uncharacterized protein n=1 Tax=Aspergillus campestris (strain IBT 28561) TaxID=1392248 RepID=A0A2I1CXQ5_ASPC2|nr:uncharacterized protein P168DRAFT_291542 [Aspergillus campestris IBT 28561]PKY02392.1 hypothetical protein P168DRAFT_291542 [Aspergillus campestris IBT 28561]